MRVPRLSRSTPELNAAEQRWWQEFADVEQRYCWVQEPAIQRFLRGGYLRDIARLTPPNARMLELGCGTGGFTTLLATMSAGEIDAIDFSPEQIARASECARQAGVADRVHFRVGDVTDLRAARLQFDAVFMHGILHHLTTDEIVSTLEAVTSVLRPDAAVVVWEPVVYDSSEVAHPARRAAAFLDRLQNIWTRGTRSGWRRYNPAETSARAAIARRNRGEAPRGPSPKEQPFTSTEIHQLLERYFAIDTHRACMARSHLVAQELLLTQITYPRLVRLARWPTLALARWLDRRLARAPTPGTWVFEMFVLRPRSGTAPLQDTPTHRGLGARAAV